MSSGGVVGVFDASAVLAYLQGEPGEEVVEEGLDAGPAWLTTVNYCEVVGKLVDKGMPLEEAAAALNELGFVIHDFDLALAKVASSLRTVTKPIGASLGDRACLALATRAAASGESPVVYTAEQEWSKLKWPFKMVVIRSARRTTDRGAGGGGR